MERRTDAADGQAYTYDEIAAFYKSKYKPSEVKAYWEEEMKPKKGKGKGKISKELEAKPKAKAKAKAKGKGKGKERGPANPKRFINEEAMIVQDCIDGLIWSTPNLARLDAYPDVKVVYRTDWKKDKVAVISGGGAGHEPMHGGFVGSGMLTAAVSGETFASPSIDAVLAGIIQVTGPKGCLLVIKNYTGDRLNFSLAAQRARSIYGLEVETVITKDDVATSAERGIAGTLFVHKVAGAMSEEGKSLSEVKREAEKVIESTASLGVSLSVVRRLKAESIGIKKMEVGLGIHGEPGARTEDLSSAKHVVEVLMEGIEAGRREKKQPEAADGYICLVNNLGSVPPQEMCIIVSALMKSKWGSSVKLLIGPAGMCTSLDMNGVSISLLPITPQLKSWITAPTACAAWPAAVMPEFPEAAKPSIKDCFEGVVASSDDAIKAMIERGCKALVDKKIFLDELDSKVGDADCGSTMSKASTGVLQDLGRLPLADPKATCACLSDVLAKTMGGSSGVLLSIMFMGMASHFAGSQNSWQDAGGKAFMAGLQAMMDAGGASEGSRTMLDALVPAAKALADGKSLSEAAAAAASGAEATKTMVPRAGRSENVPESAWRGNADPGAQAGQIFFAALAE